jgi:hypothetical protein
VVAWRLVYHLRAHLRPPSLPWPLALAGENWKNESYNGEADWELPASWREAVPTTGTLALTYCGVGDQGCTPDHVLRASLTRCVLLHAFRAGVDRRPQTAAAASSGAGGPLAATARGMAGMVLDIAPLSMD